MIKSIKESGGNVGKIDGEVGGFTYVIYSIADSSMESLMQGQANMTKRLQSFGYINIELEEDCILGNTGDKVTGKEYHRSIVKTNEEEIYKITKPKSERSWKCGYQKN